MHPVKQSTALTVLIFAHDVNGDAVTGKVDGNWTKRISKNGGAFAAMTVTITEMENGWYSVPLSTAHTDTNGILSMTFTATGVKQINIQYRVTTRIFDDGVTVAPGGIAAAAFAAGAIDAAAIANGAIDAATFAAGAIDSAAIATDAIGANELAAGAATKIRDTILSDATPFAGANINATISSRATPAQVNAEVIDVLDVDTAAELTAVPAAVTTIKAQLAWLFVLARNKILQTATTQTLRNDADAGTIATAALSDDSTTHTRAEWT